MRTSLMGSRTKTGGPLRYLAAAAALALSLASSLSTSLAASVESLPTKALADATNVSGAKCSPVKSGALKVPTITWPGDVATVHTESEGIFKSEGLANVQLFLENDFAKQVRGVLDGETPFLRGTYGMVNAAAEAFKNAGCDLTVVHQLTWSNGGDALVVRGNIKSLQDLRGKTVALQLYGPHMDLLTTVLARAGLKPTDVKIVWLKELTIPSYDTKGKALDPRTAFAESADIDAAFVISPDAMALTSNGTVGTGAEGSVKGAKILFSTKSASRVIADVYAVRTDWLNANRATAEKFVHALMLGEESFKDLLANKASNQAKFASLMSKAAQLLFGSPQAVADVEGSLADAEWVGFTGNVAFFTGAGTIRNFTVIKDEIQQAFIQLKLMKATASLNSANWDYSKLATGLKHADLTIVPKPNFDAAKVQRAVEQQIASELETWQEQGSLYLFEIYFGPRQSGFTAAEYEAAFKKALELSQTFSGALIVIEGHNSPDALQKAKSQGKSTTEIAMIEQAARNLSLQRAQAVRKAYLDYCKSKGIVVDESQFVAVGLGARDPKFATPATEAEWNANRRVVFRVKAVETELETFQAPSK